MQAISIVTCHQRTKMNEFKIIEDERKIHMKENGIQKLNFKIKKLTNDYKRLKKTFYL